MRELLDKLAAELAAGKDCYLATLVEYEGSVPRTYGAHMLVNADGYVFGTIGGGGMEYSAQLMAQKRLQAGESGNFAQSFDLRVEAGMACGGVLKVQFTHLAAEPATCEFVASLQTLAAGSEAWWLCIPLGQNEERPFVKKELNFFNHVGNFEEKGVQYYSEQYCFDGLVYIFGGGHVARELVPVLAHVGFRCVVIDDREEFASSEHFPQAVRTHCVPFTQLASVCEPTSQDYAVVMTRAHLEDTNCQRFLLQTPARYIGVMGSRTKAAFEQGKLRSEGYSEEQLARVTTPIGLDIGSETPAEIAISIAAQLIAERSKK